MQIKTSCSRFVIFSANPKLVCLETRASVGGGVEAFWNTINFASRRKRIRLWIYFQLNMRKRIYVTLEVLLIIFILLLMFVFPLFSSLCS